jgi:DHA1 family multidrug resistance protein-like MFS transporter
LSPAAELRATVLIYTATFSYMVTLGATLILVPLYGLHLGFDIGQLGVIIASQAVFGGALRLFAGATCDRFGERWVLWGSFSTMIIGSAAFGMSTSFWALILAQTFLGISRALYWTATQSYGSRINAAKSGTLFGRISSSGTVGTMVGTLAAGIVAETAGYGWAWATVVILGAVGLLGSLLLPVLPRKESQRGFKAALAPIPQLARSRSMGMGGYTAFAASASMTMSVILLVPYLKELGNSESVVSTVRTVGSVGSVVIGITFGRIVARFGQQQLYLITLSLMGVTMALVPLAGEGLAALTLIMFIYGTLHGVLGPLYPLTASTFSSQEQRGMAMAYVGLYWALAQVVIPLAFGAIALAIGLRDSFWFAGGLFLLGGLAIPVIWPLLTRVREPAEQATA